MSNYQTAKKILFREYLNTRKNLVKISIKPMAIIAGILAVIILGMSVYYLLTNQFVGSPYEVFGITAFMILIIMLIMPILAAILSIFALPSNIRFARLLKRQMEITDCDLAYELKHMKKIDFNIGTMPYTCLTEHWLITVGMNLVHKDYIEKIELHSKWEKSRNRKYKTAVHCIMNWEKPKRIVFTVTGLTTKDSEAIDAIKEWYGSDKIYTIS